MHLPARFRVPLAGIALCSVALLISACGGRLVQVVRLDDQPSSSTRCPRRPWRSSAAETVPRSKLTTLMTQVCVQYKAAKKACPKPGTAALKQLQAELRRAARAAGRVRRGGQAAQGHRQGGGRRVEPREAQAAVRQGHERQGRRREVEEGARRQPHDAGDRRREPARRARALGDLHQPDEERHGHRRRRAGLLHQEQEGLLDARERASCATSSSRTRRSPTRSTSSSRRATRSSPRSPRSTRSTRARRRTAASWAAIQKGQTVPAFDKVAFSIADR